jgi:hypothetical protein
MAYQPNKHTISKGARFVTGRRKYDKDKVKILRSQMAARKSNREDISDEQFQSYLGKLQAAGHMKINGFNSFTQNRDTDIFGTSNGGNGDSVDMYSIKFQSRMNKNMEGNRPHLTGYLQSASDADKREYKLKGWFNEDGTLRILIVN